MGYYFNGTYEGQVDSKRRMRIPSKLRAKLGENYAITVGVDHCLWILPEEAARRLQDNMSKLDMTNPQARDAKRMALGWMFTPEEDSQGRFVIPKKLASYAQIEKGIVLIGQNDYIELWAAEKQEQEASLNENIDLAQFMSLFQSEC